MRIPKYAQIHRFGDKIVLTIGEKETIYFSPNMARQIAQLFDRYVKDCEEVECMNSQLGGINIFDDMSIDQTELHNTIMKYAAITLPTKRVFTPFFDSEKELEEWISVWHNWYQEEGYEIIQICEDLFKQINN